MTITTTGCVTKAKHYKDEDTATRLARFANGLNGEDYAYDWRPVFLPSHNAWVVRCAKCKLYAC